MRILVGKYKGKKIIMPKGIRPTQNKVRKAIFDILGDIGGLSFLELYAGTGAVGFEALSQGVKEVFFVENNAACLKALKENFTHLLPAACHLLALDVSLAIDRLAKNKKQFDIIFMDPPYYREMATPRHIGMAGVPFSAAKKSLQRLGAYDILPAYGLLVVQHFKKDQLPEETGKLIRFKQAAYGDTMLSFYKKNVPESDISRNL